MTKPWFFANLIFVTFISVASLFLSEFFVSLFLVFSLAYAFFYALYILANRIYLLIKKVHFCDSLLFIPLLSNLIAVAYFFCFSSIYASMDRQAEKFFSTKTLCSETFKCSDDGSWIKTNSPIEKNYRITSENGCKVIRSPSYSFTKFHFKLEEGCKSNNRNRLRFQGNSPSQPPAAVQ